MAISTKEINPNVRINNANLYYFLVTNTYLKEMYNKQFYTTGSEEISLLYIKKYLLAQHLRGNVDTKGIEQAYINQKFNLLKQLLEEKFLQLFSDNEYNLLLKLFRINHWSWRDLVCEFNQAPINIWQIISAYNSNKK